jgi:hypothetical protein
MSDAFLQYLAEKRAKIAKQRAKLNAAEAALDQSEKHYLASGATKQRSISFEEGAVSNRSLLDTTNDALTTINRGIYRIPKNATIKERVVAVLKKSPEGLTSGQILSMLHATGLPNLERESLSPQLTRLRKDDHLIDLADGVWSLNKNEVANADDLV